MAKKNTGKSYEELVQEIYQAILDYQNAAADYKRIEVQHNVKLLGKTGNVHQIDVYWAFELAGIEYQTLVEVKDWKTPVKQEQLHSFKSVLEDIPGSPYGCFVSRSGFQSGAVTAAKHHGIKLVTINEDRPSVRIVISNIVTYYSGTEMSVDEEWIRQEKISEDALNELAKGKTQENAILLNPMQVNVRLYDLMCRDAIPYYYSEDNVYHAITTRLDGDWYWITQDTRIPRIKITEYKFECYNRSVRTTMELEFPHFIITDILSGNKHSYNAATKSLELNIAETNGAF